MAKTERGIGVIRYEYIDSSIREEDIHPDLIFDKEREMARDFVTRITMPLDIKPCFVCHTPRHEILFQKWGCQYAICPESWTVSLASLPDEEILFNYYHSSEISRFRASMRYQSEVSKKRKELWHSQIGWIEGRVSRYLGNDKYTVTDWGSKSVGWIDVLETATFLDRLFVQEPLPPINETTDTNEQADIICLIDVLQRETEPHKLLKRIASKLKPGGLFIVSCRAGSGFDVITLRENSKSIFPLDHVFLPSPRGMEILLKQAGFDVLELTTPGLLDMKYLKNAGSEIPKEQYFQRYIVEQGDEFLLERMQGFLQRNNLSSHLRCVAKRR